MWRQSAAPSPLFDGRPPVHHRSPVLKAGQKRPKKLLKSSACAIQRPPNIVPTRRRQPLIAPVLWFCSVSFFRWRRQSTHWAAIRLAVLAIAVATASGCGNGSTLVLTQQVESRRLASNLQVQFSKAADASNRAVMAVTDEASIAAVREAEQATTAIERDVAVLQPMLQALAYRDEVRHLDAFRTCFAGYRTLDADVLPLAVENTNIKAQRLSFGPAADAVNAFRESLETAGRSSAAKNTCCVDALIARATAAVLEIQVIQARHIAESDEAAMTKMEQEMAAAYAAARKSVDTLKGVLPPVAARQVVAAAASLDQFKAINAELVNLSRRNTNVRSLALSLGRKRTVTAECDNLLRVLADSLAKHDFTATR
jgi:hypothetical protein